MALAIYPTGPVKGENQYGYVARTPLASQGLFFGDFAHDKEFLDATAFLDFLDEELSEDEKVERDWWGRALCTGSPFLFDKKAVEFFRAGETATT